MVVGLYNTLVVYHTILYQIIPYYTKYHQTCNSNNWAIFQVRSSKFCIVVSLDHSYTVLYIPIHSYTFQYIPIHSNTFLYIPITFFKLGAPNFDGSISRPFIYIAIYSNTFLYIPKHSNTIFQVRSSKFFMECIGMYWNI